VTLKQDFDAWGTYIPINYMHIYQTYRLGCMYTLLGLHISPCTTNMFFPMCIRGHFHFILLIWCWLPTMQHFMTSFEVRTVHSKTLDKCIKTGTGSRHWPICGQRKGDKFVFLTSAQWKIICYKIKDTNNLIRSNDAFTILCL
jgi:hypothetical protein